MDNQIYTYRTVYKTGTGEILEKKSRFIANVYPVETETEAVEQIEKLRKQYWDARHNCYAYIIGKDGKTLRCSDDGEPSGTAGKPMLEVLQRAEMKNVLAVVTRYFGGVLLGTGGLVRAYTQALQEGLKDAGAVYMEEVCPVVIRTDYNAVGKIKYCLSEQKIKIMKEEYTQQVCLEAAVPIQEKEALYKQIVELTNGRAVMEEKELLFLPKTD